MGARTGNFSTSFRGVRKEKFWTMTVFCAFSLSFRTVSDRCGKRFEENQKICGKESRSSAGTPVYSCHAVAIQDWKWSRQYALCRDVVVQQNRNVLRLLTLKRQTEIMFRSCDSAFTGHCASNSKFFRRTPDSGMTVPDVSCRWLSILQHQNSCWLGSQKYITTPSNYLWSYSNVQVQTKEEIKQFCNEFTEIAIAANWNDLVRGQKNESRKWSRCAAATQKKGGRIWRPPNFQHGYAYDVIAFAKATKICAFAFAGRKTHPYLLLKVCTSATDVRQGFFWLDDTPRWTQNEDFLPEHIHAL